MRSKVKTFLWVILAIAVLERVILFIADYNIRSNHADFDRRYQPELIVGGKHNQLCKDVPVLVFYKYRTCFSSHNKGNRLLNVSYNYWAPRSKISFLNDEFAYSDAAASRTLARVVGGTIKKTGRK